ncbi:MAG: hypothetical protein SGPRY_005436, partial [Prymnesium sp.]
KRKRPEGPRGRAKAVRITKETTVPASRRLVEFRDEGFKLSMGKLFCVPCRETVQNLKEGLKRHVTIKKHKNGLLALRWSQNADPSLAGELTDYFIRPWKRKGCVL